MVSFASVLFGACLAALLAVRCNTLLVYFQQEEYDSTRYITAWRNVRLYDVLASVGFLVTMLLALLTGAEQWMLIVASLLFLVVAVRESKYKYKKPVVNTQRLRKIRAVALVLLALLAFCCVLWTPLTLVVLQIVPLVIVIANLVLQPSQQRINNNFINEARLRLGESNALRIGVTGSFGKTTVKHMLAEMLEVGGPVFYSEGSVNTVLGLTRHIRQRLQPGHRYFVAEMGAYQKGSIARLCDFVKPGYGIVTAIGEAHAERFGGLEHTAIAKAELADFVCAQGGVLVASEDVMTHEPFKKLHQQYPQSFVVVGHAASNTVQITAAELKDGAWHIELLFPDRKTFAYSIPLLGNHNVMNSALAVALVYAIEPALVARLKSPLSQLQQVAHRLELKESAGSPLILDDAYNSNEKGFCNAVEVLHQLADEKGGRAILVTPGIAELGDEHASVHQKLGEFSADLCDIVVVVNPERIPTFVSGLQAKKAPLQVIQAASLVEARHKLDDLSLTAEDIVLYENDLPDLLEETRVL